MSNKPIAVLSGSVWTSVGAELMGDHVVEMLSPTNTWGREFLTLQIANRTSGDVFRITGVYFDKKVISQKHTSPKNSSTINIQSIVMSNFNGNFDFLRGSFV